MTTPWTIKNIPPEDRLAALAAAERTGLPLDLWLCRAIRTQIAADANANSPPTLPTSWGFDDPAAPVNVGTVTDEKGAQWTEYRRPIASVDFICSVCECGPQPGPVRCEDCGRVVEIAGTVGEGGVVNTPSGTQQFVRVLIAR